MSRLLAVPVSMAAPPSRSEENETSPASANTPSSAPAPAPKLPSCVVCRSRKVRCDKQSPCSNCRRANIACVFPSADRLPRWSRRLERLTNNAAASITPAPQAANPGVDGIMKRLRDLENLVKELSGQLEHALAAASSAGGSSSDINSSRRSIQDPDAAHQRDTAPATNTSSVQKQFGRLVLQDTSRSRYVSSGFWSRVNDEVSRLVMVTPSS